MKNHGKENWELQKKQREEEGAASGHTETEFTGRGKECPGRLRSEINIVIIILFAYIKKSVVIKMH